jgi:hypothetical protein
VFGSDGTLAYELLTDNQGRLISGGGVLPTGAATEAKQDTQITLLTTIDADTSKIPASPSTEGKQDDVIVLLTAIDADTSRIIAAPATEAKQDTIIGGQATTAAARTFTRTSVTWTADDGTAEVDLTLASGTYYLHAVGHENAVAAGSATYQIHISTETGFTPGANRYECYTSTAALVLPTGGYDAFLAPVPITVTGDTVYVRIVPNAGTTTGALDIYTTPNQ